LIFTILFFPFFSHAKNPEISTLDLIQKGQIVYTQNCLACHGEKGDGKGVAAKAIKGNKPRDFTVGRFKFGSRPKELFGTVTKGIPESMMPSWVELSEEDRWAVVHFVKSLKKK